MVTHVRKGGGSDDNDDDDDNRIQHTQILGKQLSDITSSKLGPFLTRML